jgi:biopolymer transport protein ExbB
MAINNLHLASGFFDQFVEWNVILILLAGCSVVSFAVFVERVLHLRNASSNTVQLMGRLRHAITSGNIDEALRTCKSAKGTIPEVLQAGLARHGKGKIQIESAMEVAGIIRIAELERNTRILSIIAHIAPLIGLLGTVLGFIQAFGAMRSTGMMDMSVNKIGSAMEYALETTAAGLVVAIPTVVAYNYLVSRIEGYLLNLQAASAEVVDLLIHKTEANGE